MSLERNQLGVIPVPPSNQSPVLALSEDWGLRYSEPQVIFLPFPRAEVPECREGTCFPERVMESVSLGSPAPGALARVRIGG